MRLTGRGKVSAVERQLGERQSVPQKRHTFSGGYGWRVPPVPIPNTEVKPPHADGTWLVTARESRSLPDSKWMLEKVILSPTSNNIHIPPLSPATQVYRSRMRSGTASRKAPSTGPGIPQRKDQHSARISMGHSTSQAHRHGSTRYSLTRGPDIRLLDTPVPNIPRYPTHLGFYPYPHSSVAQWQSIRLLTEGL